MNAELTSSRFPYVPIRWQVGQQTHQADALLDTGFDGGIAVPPTFLEEQAADLYQRWTLADGRQVQAAVFRGTVQLGTFHPKPTYIVALGDEHIIGLGVLNNFTVTFDHGRRVIVSP